MSTDILLIEKKDRVATLIFNRPEKRNSLSPDLLIRIHQTLEDFAREDAIRAVVFGVSVIRPFHQGTISPLFLPRSHPKPGKN